MKVYVYVKHQVNPDTNDYASPQEGDIILVHPMQKLQGRKTLDDLVPVVMDINIPCGQGGVSGMDFSVTGSIPDWNCGECPFNDIVNCDVVKYTSAIWSAGDILNPPQIVRFAKYKIDISGFLDALQIVNIKKKTKTEIEKKTIYDLLKTKEQSKVIVEAKI